MARNTREKGETRFEQAVRLACNESLYDERVFGTIVEADPGALAELGIEPDGSVYLEAHRNGRPVAIAAYREIQGSFYVHSVWMEEGDVEGVTKLFQELRSRAATRKYRSIEVQICQERRHIVKLLKGVMDLQVSVFFCEMPVKEPLPSLPEPQPKLWMRRRIPHAEMSSQLCLISLHQT